MAKKSNGDVSGWTGWVAFAAIMLYIAGFFHLVAGFAALFTDKVYYISEKALWTLDYTQWGWIHVLGGLLAILAASSLAQGNAYGRIVAVLVAVISAIANMIFIPIYPIWALTIIVVDILVIYAVIVHGGEMKNLEK